MNLTSPRHYEQRAQSALAASAAQPPITSSTQSEVQRGLDELFVALNRAGDVVNMLAERLTPVKAAYPPETKSENACSPTCASSVGVQLSSASSCVHDLCRRLLTELDLLAI
jgi:hypothetical protein